MDLTSGVIRPMLDGYSHSVTEGYLKSFDEMAKTLRPGLVSNGIKTAELLVIMLVHALGMHNLEATSILLKTVEGANISSQLPVQTGEEFQARYGVREAARKEAAKFAARLDATGLFQPHQHLFTYISSLRPRVPRGVAQSQLWTAVDGPGVEEAVREGADLEAADGWCMTALHTAAQAGHLEAVRTLISFGADLERKDCFWEWTALHYAAKEGRAGCVSLLLGAGARIRAELKNGWTPLHLAARDGHLDTARLLLESGASVSAEDNYRLTPLHLAANRGHLDVVRLLLDSGADVNAKDKDGFSPLHYVAIGGFLDTAKLLLQAGADLKSRDKNDRTPLDLAYGSELQSLLTSERALQ